MKWTWACLGLLLAGACLKGPLERDVWEQEAPGTYQFEDYNLRVQFETQGHNVQWRFHNKARRPLSIAYPSFFFVIEGDDTTYSPWGAPKTQEPSIPPIEVRAGGFVTLRYPVRFRSPLTPFQVSAERGISLYFTAQWEDSLQTYELVFPEDPEEPVIAN